jgi:hypothetical protein
VERHKLQFRLGGEMPLFKLCLEVEIWFWKVLLEGLETNLECFPLKRYLGLEE